MNEFIVQRITGCDNLREINKNMIAGTYHGYHTIIRINEKLKLFSISVNGRRALEDIDMELDSFLSDLTMFSKRKLKCAYRESRMKVDGSIPKESNEEIEELVIDLLDRITAYYKKNEYVNCCTICEKPNSELILCKYIEKPAYICECCYEEKDAEHKIKGYTRGKGSVIKGILGAFLGALLGCALLTTISVLGYISGIAGILIAVGAYAGYILLGKDESWKGIVITLIITIVMIYMGFRISYVISYMVENKGASLSFFKLYNTMGELLSTNKEFRGVFIANLLQGYGSTGAVGIVMIIRRYTSKDD